MIMIIKNFCHNIAFEFCLKYFIADLAYRIVYYGNYIKKAAMYIAKFATDYIKYNNWREVYIGKYKTCYFSNINNIS